MGTTLRGTLGVQWTDAQMRLPQNARDVERVGDPKKILNDVMRRLSRSIEDHYGQLGERNPGAEAGLRCLRLELVPDRGFPAPANQRDQMPQLGADQY